MDDFEITASSKKLLTLAEILADEIKRKDEGEKLDLTDGIVDTIKSPGEEVIKLFQEDIESVDILEGAKVALRALSKFPSVLTENKFKRAEKTKNLLKIAAKIVNKISEHKKLRPKIGTVLSGQRPIRNKNILNRKVRDRGIKIEKLLPHFKNIQVKNRGRVLNILTLSVNEEYSTDFIWTNLSVFFIVKSINEM